MKTLKKLSAFLLTLMLSVGVVSMPVMAAGDTVKQDGLEITLTTDKEEYSDGEEIKLTLKVKNTNAEAVTDLQLANFVSDGYELTEESIQALKEFVALGAGAEESVSLTVVKKDTGNTDPDDDKDNTQSSILKSPKTGDSNNIALWVVVFCAGVALVGVAYAIKKKKAKQALSVMLCVAMAASAFVTSSESVSAKVQTKTITLEKTVKYAGKDVTFKADFSYKFDDGSKDDGIQDGNQGDTGTDDGYKLVWADEFDGTELNRDDWNVELHDPGWVNAELQEYVDSEDNIAVKDGKLVITPIQVKNEDGSYSYTSGRINTQNKQTFTYGKFEARVKVPTGKGYLPAFWLMANDENVYGQWPRCGEIDIMEVHGSATKTAYGTIHYGNPHSESQGTYSLSEGSFADDFHTFTCEWEPGKISWYVDGILFHTENDWYSATVGQGEITYPAPFDQPFYVILNLAVGGSWVGYPDDATFATDTYEVDYVRVYQKDSYDENVSKPVKDVVLRDPDANGNFIINGDFSVAEDLTDDAAWKFLTDLGGEATAEIKNNEIVIHSTNAGTVDYSVQLVQADLPMREGASYTLTFDAYADAPRNMIVDVSAPDRSYARYLNNTKVDLTTEKQSYTYTFKMTQSDDANGRLEFNLGNQGSVADVHISNVKLKQSGYEAPSDEVIKTVLADGNHVYNGQFQEGSDRMEYWTVTNQVGADVSVTNLKDGRRLKVVIPESAGAEATVTVAQEDLALVAGAEYAISYEAEGNVAVTVEGVTYASGTVITANNNAEDNHIVLTFKGSGTYYIDNVRIDENKLIKNGSFSAGEAGFEGYINSAADASWGIDSITEGNNSAAMFTINDTGNLEHYIQLKQTGVKLIEGHKYKLTLDARVLDLPSRMIKVALQRDGSSDNDWTAYSGDNTNIELTNQYTTHVLEFTMNKPTDLNTIFSISMGPNGVWGDGVTGNEKRITTTHRVCIDNIVLEDLGIQESSGETEENMLTNPNFDDPTNPLNGWVTTWDTQWGQSDDHIATASAEVKDGALVYNITNVGKLDYSVQLKQEHIDFEAGATYKVSFDVSSTVPRTIKFALMGKNDSWYAGKDDISVTTEKSTVTFEFTPKAGMSTYEDLSFQLSLGKVGNASPSTLTFSNMKLFKVKSGEATTVTLSDINLVKTKDATGAGITDGTNLAVGDWKGSTSVENGVVKTTVTNPGENPWDVQLELFNINLEANCEYTLTFKAKADADKLIQVGLQQNGEPYTVYSLHEGSNIAAKLTNSEQAYTIVFKMNSDGDSAAKMFFNLGKINETDAGYILPADQQDGTQGDSPVVGGLLQNANFAKNGENWYLYTESSANAAAECSYENGKAKINITNPGTDSWHVKLTQNGLNLENGATYRVKFKVKSDNVRFVCAGLQTSDYKWSGDTEWHYVNANTVSEFEKTVVFNSTLTTNVEFCVKLGYFNNNEITSPTQCSVEISDIVLEKVTGEGNTNLIQNGDFSNEKNNWDTNIFSEQNNGPEGTASISGNDAAMVYQLTKVGSQNWHVQLKQKGLHIESGVTYLVKFDITSTASRKVEYGFYSSTDESLYLGASMVDLEANVLQNFVGEITPSNNGDTFTISMGQMFDWSTGSAVPIETPPSTITIDNISIVKK